MTRRHCFTIGELARRTGASIKAIRLYDQLGLLVTAGRSSSNYRLFGDDAVVCVRCIKAFQAAGLSLRDMQELARGHEAGGDFRAKLSRKLEEALERTDAKLERLESSRRALSELVRLAAGVRTEDEVPRLLTLPLGAGSNLASDGSSDVAHPPHRSQSGPDGARGRRGRATREDVSGAGRRPLQRRR